MPKKATIFDFCHKLIITIPDIYCTNLEEREEGGLAGADDALDVDGEGAAASAVEMRAQLGEVEGGELTLIVRHDLILGGGVTDGLQEDDLVPEFALYSVVRLLHLLYRAIISSYSQSAYMVNFQ